MEKGEDKREPIERLSPAITVKIGELALVLTYANASVYLFGNGYDYMNHTYIVEPTKMFVFDNQELMDALHENEFPQISMPYPAESDIDAYLDWQSNKLDSELNQL